MKEEKELLFQDLGARLVYGVKCNVWYGPKSPALNEKDKYTDDILETINPQKGNCTFHNAIGYNFGFFPIEHVKPYLRRMSSMTEEEKNELKEYLDAEEVDCNGFGYTEGGTLEDYVSNIPYSLCKYVIDWLNKNMLDYRGLISMGLALEAPKEMYGKI